MDIDGRLKELLRAIDRKANGELSWVHLTGSDGNLAGNIPRLRDLVSDLVREGYLNRIEKQDIVPCQVRLTPSGRRWIADQVTQQISEGNVSMSKAEPVDIVIVTIIPEEFEAVCNVFGIRDLVYFPDASPNLYSWRLGTVSHEPSGRHFRVVVGMLGRPTNASSSVAIIDAINIFHPEYILMVGIAGGFPKDKITKGDVVISNLIFGYQYGKLEKVFHPRSHFSYQVDTGLLNAAQSLAAITSGWNTKIGERPEKGELPKCVPGVVASGDMVVDDADNAFFTQVLNHYPSIAAVEMEGAGAAAAIQYAKDKKSSVGFLMIRGISDMPRRDSSISVQSLTDDELLPAPSNVELQSTERDAWKRYAANSAAHFTFFMVTKTWPVTPRSQVSFLVNPGTGMTSDTTSLEQAVTAEEVPAQDWELFAQLYPRGPLQEDVWMRSGGDASRLNLKDSGRAQWFSAIELLKNGGGGTSLRRLANTALSDHPGNAHLKELVSRLN